MVNFAINSAVSGLLAQSQSLQNSANNIANARTIGEIPEEGDTPPFQPFDTQFSPAKGGVKAEAVERDPAFTPLFAPDSTFANEEGLVAAPNVDLAEELINAQVASIAYKANAAVIRTADEIADETLDILS